MLKPYCAALDLTRKDLSKIIEVWNKMDLLEPEQRDAMVSLTGHESTGPGKSRFRH